MKQIKMEKVTDRKEDCEVQEGNDGMIFEVMMCFEEMTR